MKMIYKTLAALSFFFAYISACAVPDSCLKIVLPDDGKMSMNKDSIKAD